MKKQHHSIASKRFFIGHLLAITSIGLFISMPAAACTSHTSCHTAVSSTAPGTGTYCNGQQWTPCPTGTYNDNTNPAGSDCCPKELD